MMPPVSGWILRTLAGRLRGRAPVFLLLGLNVLLFLLFYGRFGDLIVDCSREATIPWRILHGGVLYRDFNYEYGPLAPYLLALCYRLFGVRLLTLNLAGLVIVSAVTLEVYALARLYLNRLLALGAGLLFIFGFAYQFAGAFNIFSYIFPYTYAASLGVLLLLALLLAGRRVLETGQPRAFIRLGLCYALACLTKVEFIAAANLFVFLLFTLLALKARREGRLTLHRALRRAWAFAWPAGTVLLPVGAYFFLQVDLLAYYRNELARMTALDLPAARAAMGTDFFLLNLIVAGVSVLAYSGLTLALFGLDRYVQRLGSRPRSFLLAVLELLVAGAAIGLVFVVKPINLYTGMSVWILVIGLLALRAAWNDWRAGRMSTTPIFVLCLAAVSFELIIRVAFNVRPIGYSVFLMVPAFLLLLFSVFAFLPAWLRRRGSSGRFHVWGFVVFFTTASVLNFAFSLHNYRAKNVAVPTARGTLRLRADQASALNQLLAYFHDKHDFSLLVLPEGNLINFLLDSPPQTYSYAYVPGLMKTPAQEDRIIRELDEKKIDYILVVTRWTTEFGYSIIGGDYALRLKAAIDRDYQAIVQFGPPPFNEQGVFGMLLLERNRPPVTAK